jgi:hypothetical protein
LPRDADQTNRDNVVLGDGQDELVVGRHGARVVCVGQMRDGPARPVDGKDAPGGLDDHGAVRVRGADPPSLSLSGLDARDMGRIRDHRDLAVRNDSHAIVKGNDPPASLGSGSGSAGSGSGLLFSDLFPGSGSGSSQTIPAQTG